MIAHESDEADNACDDNQNGWEAEGRCKAVVGDIQVLVQYLADQRGEGSQCAVNVKACDIKKIRRDAECEKENEREACRVDPTGYGIEFNRREDPEN